MFSAFCCTAVIFTLFVIYYTEKIFWDVTCRGEGRGGSEKIVRENLGESLRVEEFFFFHRTPSDKHVTLQLHLPERLLR
jgi:hypothetical protein